jgi:hypothetical protein
MTTTCAKPKRSTRTLAYYRVPAVLALALAAAGCSEVSSYEERVEYLNTVSTRGVELHELIVAGDGEPDDERCRELYAGLEEEVPSFEDWDTNLHEEEEAFIAQAEQVFVDSCLSGQAASVDLLDVMESVSPATPTESAAASK